MHHLPCSPTAINRFPPLTGTPHQKLIAELAAREAASAAIPELSSEEDTEDEEDGPEPEQDVEDSAISGDMAKFTASEEATIRTAEASWAWQRHIDDRSPSPAPSKCAPLRMAEAVNYRRIQIDRHDVVVGWMKRERGGWGEEGGGGLSRYGL